MKSPTVRVCLWFGVAATSLAIAPDASACVQGYHLPKGEKVDLVPVPQVKAKGEIAKLPLEWPKMEPAKITGLLGGPVGAVPAQPAQAKDLAPDPEAPFIRYVQEFEARPAGVVASFEDTTDYAVALIHLGRSPEAIKVLVMLETKQPGVYTTAANLGTAYELTGNLEAALKWISAGVERNAGSHHGTEWLHVAILRAKINLKRDETWLAKHSVLDAADQREAGEVLAAIEYQLGERLHFVQPADAVVCDLFYQAALRVSGEQAQERKARYLRESLRFGDWRKAEVEVLGKS